MTDRRTEILDGALAVLAEQGMRGLTHRAVDRAVDLPTGSTSYYFRTRAALVQGCVARLLELDMAIELPALLAAGRELLPDVLAQVGAAMATTGRLRTLARYELHLAAMRDSQLREHLVRGGDRLRGLAAEALAGWGFDEAEELAAALADALDGMVFVALLRGPTDPAVLADRLRPRLARLLGSPRTGPEPVLNRP